MVVRLCQVKIPGRLLNPYAVTEPPIMSTSWKTPGCVHGSETIRTSGWLGERFMRIRRNWIVEGVMKRDVHESMYDERAVMIRKDDLARLNRKRLRTILRKHIRHNIAHDPSTGRGVS